MKQSILSCIFAIAISVTLAHAHHSIAGAYDSNQRRTVEGIVTQFQFISPHPFLTIDVKQDDGVTQSWKLEMDNRHELSGVGMTAETFKAGDRVIVTGSLARGQARSLYISKLDRPADGFQYEQVGSSPRVRSRGRSR